MADLSSFYVTFAADYNVSVIDSYVIPSVFENAAKKAKMSVLELLDATITNRDVGNYLKEVIEKVAAAERKNHKA